MVYGLAAVGGSTETLSWLKANLGHKFRKVKRRQRPCLQINTLALLAYYSVETAEASQQTQARLVKQQRGIFPKATRRRSDQCDNLLL